MTARLTYVVFVLCLLAGCKAAENTSEATMIQATGTVQYVDLEGGFYGIVGDEGTRYDPTNLSEDFREDGLRVSFRARERRDVLTIRMWGQVVELIEIERE